MKICSPVCGLYSISTNNVLVTPSVVVNIFSIGSCYGLVQQSTEPIFACLGQTNPYKHIPCNFMQNLKFSLEWTYMKVFKLSNWLDFDHDLFSLIGQDLKRLEFSVSEQFLDIAWKEWPDILRDDHLQNWLDFGHGLLIFEIRSNLS